MRYCIVFFAVLLFCGPVWAGDSTTDGAPAFLILSFPLFTAGLIWSCCIEGVIYRHYLGGPLGKAIWVALGVNLLSGLIVGIGLPFAVAFITGIGIFIGGGLGEGFAALGSWVFKDSSFRGLAIATTIPWMMVSFWLTVKFELWYIERRLFVGHDDAIDFKSMCLNANIVGYAGLLIMAVSVGIFYNL